MNFELKPIKKLILGSIILHIAGLCVSLLLLLFAQRPFWPIYTGSHFPEGSTLFFPPVVVSAPIILIFILHGCLTVVFLRVLNYGSSHLDQLRILSILSMIVVAIVFPIVSILWGYVEHFIIARTIAGTDDFLASIILRNLMSFGLVIRGVSISVLLIAASMSWYYCFIKKTDVNLASPQ